MGLQRGGQHLSGPVKQVTANRRLNLVSRGGRSIRGTEHGDVDGPGAEQQEADRQGQTHDAKARARRVQRLGLVALDPQESGHVGRSSLGQGWQGHAARLGRNLFAERPETHQFGPPAGSGSASANSSMRSSRTSSPSDRSPVDSAGTSASANRGRSLNSTSRDGSSGSKPR